MVIQPNPIALSLAPRPRLLDPWDAANLLGEEVDQEPHPRNARALGDDQHVQRNGWQRIAGQDRFEPAGAKEIVDQPVMGGSNAAPGDKGLARGQSMVDPKTSAERHGMLFAARPAKREEVASRDVRHPDALMAGQILRD